MYAAACRASVVEVKVTGNVTTDKVGFMAVIRGLDSGTIAAFKTGRGDCSCEQSVISL